MSGKFRAVIISICMGFTLPSLGQDKPAAATAIPFVAVDIKEPILFDKHVFKILSDKCISCHDAAGGLAEGDLDLTTVASILKGGKKGHSILAGKGAESLLIQLSSRAVKPFMPPKKDQALSSLELSILKTWIDQGAKPGENLSPASMEKKSVSVSTLPTGFQPVYALDMTGDGQWLAVGRGSFVDIYDVNKGELTIRLTGLSDVVQSVKISPDVSMVAAGGFETAKIWRVPGARVKRVFAGHAQAVNAAVADPTGNLAWSGGDDGILRLWDLYAGTILRESVVQGGAITALAVDPFAGIVAVASADKSIRLLRTVDHAETAVLAGHTDIIMSLEYSPSGKEILSASRDGTLRRWNLAKPGESTALTPPQQQGPLRGAYWNRSTIISVREAGGVVLWNIEDGKLLKEIAVSAQVFASALSPEGESLAVGTQTGVLQFVNLAAGTAGPPIALGQKSIESLSYRYDGKRLFAGNAEGQWTILDPVSGKVLTTNTGHTGAINSAFYLPQGTILTACADKNVRLLEFDETWSLAGDVGPLSERVGGLAFSPDSRFLATGAGTPSRVGEIIIWDAARREKVIALKDPHTDVVLGLAFSPDGKKIASCSADKFLKVHDASTGQKLRTFEGHTNHVLGVAWSPDGTQLATASADASIKLWSYDAGELVKNIGGHPKQITGIAWVGKTTQLVTVSSDKLGRLVDVNSGGVVRGFEGAKDFLYAVAVSIDGKTLAAGTQDGNVFVWDGTTGQLLKTFAPPAPEKALQASR